MSSSELSQPPVSYRTRLRSRAARWRENPERLAWIIMLVSFAIFVMLLFAIPSATSYSFRYLTISQQANLKPMLGTTGKLLLYPASGAEGIGIVADRDDLSEGMRVVSRDGATQGVIEFLDETAPQNVIGTLRMFSNTEFDVLLIRRPLFQSSPEPYQVVLRVKGGQLRILSSGSPSTASHPARPLKVEIQTPHGVAYFGTGNYQLSVNPNQTDVSVHEGTAKLVQQKGKTVALGASSRRWMDSENIAEVPQDTAQSLVSNSVLEASDLSMWQEAPIGQAIAGEINFTEFEGRRVSSFTHEGDLGHSEVGRIYKIDRDISSYDSLTLQMDAKVLFQSLPGAGQMISEYPIRAEIEYTDLYGKNLRWGYGFYFREPKDNEPYPKPVDNESGRAIRVPQQGNWYPFQSENLIELWKARGTPPDRINSIRIYASGHSYQAMVSEVYLIVK